MPVTGQERPFHEVAEFYGSHDEGQTSFGKSQDLR
jgi:hypothetical protein